MLFVVSDFSSRRFPFFRLRKKSRKAQMGHRKVSRTVFFPGEGAKGSGEVRSLIRPEHGCNFVCTKIIINILCCKFDLTAKIFKFPNET